MTEDNLSLEEEKKNSLLWNNYKEALNQAWWKMIGTILVGLFAGLLVFRSSEKSEEPNVGYFFVIFAIFVIIGVTIGLVTIIKLRKKYHDVIVKFKQK